MAGVPTIVRSQGGLTMPKPGFAGHKFKITKHTDEIRCPGHRVQQQPTHDGWTIEFSDELEDNGRSYKGKVEDTKGNSSNFSWRDEDGRILTTDFAFGSCPNGWHIEFYRPFHDRPALMVLEIDCVTTDANDCVHETRIRMEQQ
jgi:hypothetical protein